MVDVPSLASTRSSYSESFAPTSATTPPSLSKGMVNGHDYRDVVMSSTQHSRMNSNMSTVPKKRRDSVVLTVNDPVAMHLLVETAIADSSSYDILTYEEVEELKKELQISTNRVSALKRKLVLETKLQEAASSLNRLPSSGRTSSNGTTPTSPRSNDDASLDRNGTAAARSRTQSTANSAIVSAKTDEMSEKLAKEESANFQMRRRLLEHTAGVLQLTYNGDGLRNSRSRGYGNAAMDDNHRDRNKLNGNMTPESMAHDFSEESLYKDADVLDDINIDNEGLNARDEPNGHPDAKSEEQDTIKDTRERLGLLCDRMHGVLQESGVNSSDLATPPEDSANIKIQLAYLEKSIASVPNMSRSDRETGIVSGEKSDQMIISATTRINDILNNTASPTQEKAEEASPQHASGGELTSVLDQLEKHVAKLADQKSILTRQIQQQRELNEKSDAERDEYIADLQEELAMFEGELGLAKEEVGVAQERIAEYEREVEMQDKLIQEHNRKAAAQKEKENEDASADENENATSADHLAELEAIKAEVKLHKETAEQLQRDLDAKDFEADTHREARLSLEEQITLKEEEISQHKEALDDFVRQSIDAQNEMNMLKEQNNSLNRELAEKNQLLEACIERLEKVAPELAAKMSSASDMANDDDKLARDEELRDLRESVEDMERQLRNKEAEMGMVEEQITSLQKAAAEREQALEAAMASAEASKAEIEGLRRDKETAERELAVKQEALEEKNKEMADLQTVHDETRDQMPTTSPADLDELNALRQRVVESDSKISALEAELAMAGEAVSIAHSNLARRRTDIEGDTRARGNGTEEAGGSSSSSAADSTSSNDLRVHIKMMENELRDTIEDHEGLVKASIEFERERGHLETVIDQLREKCEKLEIEISERQLEDVANGEKRGSDGGVVKQQVSIRTLKEEFKKLMREARKEHMKMLRLEQEERKRLEALVISSRRGQQSLADQFGAVGVSQEQNLVVEPTQG